MVAKKKLIPAVLFVLFHFSLSAQKSISLSGKITDATSNPVANATVHVLNTSLTVLADKEGNYVINNIIAGQYTVSFSAIGYATLNKDVNIASPTNNLDVQLKDATAQLDDVVVTAEKKEESVQKIPLSITTLSSKDVTDYRLWNSKELTAIVPNMYSNNSGDERNVTSVRGITTTSYDPAVATYIDGVNQFSLDTYINTLFDVERIEVLRGPQGTLYGRNAMGGVINIITKQPSNITNGFAEINIGNHDQQRYTLGLRTPLIKDKLFLGVAGVYNKRDGFYTNKYYDDSYDKLHTFTGNYYLKYLPANDWSITLNVMNQENRNNGPFPLSGTVEEAFASPYVIEQNAVAKMIDNTLDASLTVYHSGAAFNFTSLSAWQHNYRYYNNPLDGDFSALDAVTIINDYGSKWNNVKVFTQEFRLTSPANTASPFKWTTGVYFFHQNIPNKQATHFGKDAGLLGVPDTDFATINTSKGNNTGIAAYGQISYSITKKLDLVGGLRYDYENKKLNVEGEYAKDDGPSFVTLPDTAASVDFSALSPKLGLNYAAAENSNVFVTYSRGYRTGGLTQLSSDPSQPPLYPYKPEYSNNIEAGIKNNFWQDKLQLNFTAFYTLVDDAQVPTLILPDAITVTKNTGKLNSKGIEVELATKPVKGLQIDYNFGYTDAVYKSLKIAQNGETVDMNGKKQIFTPQYTSMLAAQYAHAVGKKQALQIIVRGEWSSFGKEYFDLANNIKQSPYSLFNVRAGIAAKHFELFFWGRNLSDEKYIAYAYDFGAVHLGDPKTYGVTLRVKM
ncbi:MAG TPA: TonB-dependent receptor [Parafilimonas sp.]|nr:TonB-dependent receptor [Parafilimonas sp.]